MLKKPAPRSLPRSVRRKALVARPRVDTARLPPLASEPAVRDGLATYFELRAAHQDRPASVSQESLDASLAQLTQALQVAEAEYHRALAKLRR